MVDERLVREQILWLLRGGGAHLPVEKALAGVPVASRGVRPRGLPHSPWEILEHLRIAQWDILEYIRNPSHESPTWPAGYWPHGPEVPGSRAWSRSLAAFRADLEAMAALVSDPSADLTAQIPHGEPGHTLLREALVLADHNAYHAAEMVAVRRLLGIWSR
jgi:hypothetical protein